MGRSISHGGEARNARATAHGTVRRSAAASNYTRSVVTERTSVRRDKDTVRGNGQHIAINSSAVENMDVEDDFEQWD